MGEKRNDERVCVEREEGVGTRWVSWVGWMAEDDVVVDDVVVVVDGVDVVVVAATVRRGGDNSGTE